MTKRAEKRTNSRTVIHEPLTLERSERRARPEHVLIDGVGVDLSSEGVGIFADDELQEGEVLKLHYPVNIAGTSLPVYTVVMWARPAKDHFRAGLRFLA